MVLWVHNCLIIGNVIRNRSGTVDFGRQTTPIRPLECNWSGFRTSKWVIHRNGMEGSLLGEREGTGEEQRTRTFLHFSCKPIHGDYHLMSISRGICLDMSSGSLVHRVSPVTRRLRMTGLGGAFLYRLPFLPSLSFIPLPDPLLDSLSFQMHFLLVLSCLSLSSIFISFTLIVGCHRQQTFRIINDRLKCCWEDVGEER